MKNIKITAEELRQLRELPDFDLTMILSDIHDNGWLVARKTLAAAVRAVLKNNGVSTDKGAQA
jgi:hypothetical protein